MPGCGHKEQWFFPFCFFLVVLWLIPFKGFFLLKFFESQLMIFLLLGMILLVLLQLKSFYIVIFISKILVI